MKAHEKKISRRRVIEFYAAYDRGKKAQSPVTATANWPWDDPDGLDQKLEENHLKKGVLAAYTSWVLCELDVSNLLECAIVNRIFPGEPQTLSQLVLRGKLKEWFPIGAPMWWRVLGSGTDFGMDTALILRPALTREKPAKWYVEDGSGRVLALLQRILRYGEISRTAWAYIGDTPDESSAFIKSHLELKDRRALS